MLTHGQEIFTLAMFGKRLQSNANNIDVGCVTLQVRLFSALIAKQTSLLSMGQFCSSDAVHSEHF
jgi:hypothetical protein